MRERPSLANKTRGDNYPLKAMMLLLVIALVYWLWFGLTQRSIIGDEGISILAAQGVLEHGYPRLPSGYLYHRAYLPNYLLAGSIGVFGLNDFSILLPSLLLALGSLWLAYLFARDVLGSAWVGVAATTLLLTLQIQTFYATSARMYMALQFFAMLAIYSAYRGYLLGEAKFQYVTGLAIAAAILSHEQGGALLVAIPLALGIVRWIRDRKLLLPLTLLSWAALLIAVIVALFIYVYEPQDIKPSIAVHGGQELDRVGLNLNLRSWVGHVDVLNHVLPFVLFLLPLTFFLGIKFRLPQPGLAYSVATFALCGFLIMIVLREYGLRYWFFMIPLYVLLVCVGAVAIFETLGLTAQRWLRGDVVSRRAVLSLLAIGIILNFGPPIGRLYFKHEPLISLIDVVKEGYGIPCLDSLMCHKNIKNDYSRIREQMSSEDLIISSNQTISHYYLGRVDGLLREKTEPGAGFSAFSSPTEEYFGQSLIDSIEELHGLLEGERRVWVILNYKAKTYSSEATHNYLNAMYETYYKDEFLTVYVNCMKPPCRAKNGN